MNLAHYLTPDWPAPAKVKAYSTTRQGGHSGGVYASMNLGTHVDDDLQTVMHNRTQLTRDLALPATVAWLQQTHSTDVIDCNQYTGPQNADAALTRELDQVCIVMTADCLPVLLCDQHGREVAAVHAGWRGLAQGVIENTLAAMQTNNVDIMAWLGPAIGPQHFQVGADVRAQFVTACADNSAFFTDDSEDKYLCDLFALARAVLNRHGVERVYGGDQCTYSDPQRYFSYRRDGQTGRMASMIWLSE